MKIKKVLVLALLIVSVLALTVASQISQVTSTISVEELKDCTISYYNNTENVYGYVTKTRETRGLCLNPLNLSYYPCVNGTESYQSYEIVGSQIVLKNQTDCISRNSYVISIDKKGVIDKKEIDFSDFGPCIYNTENNCLVVTCVSKYDGAHNGQFTDCRGGKSCQKFVICDDNIKVYYRNSRENFAENDPTFYLPQLALKGVGQ